MSEALKCPVGWRVVYEHELPPRLPRYASVAGLPVDRRVIDYLERSYPQGLYLHQRFAAALSVTWSDVCLTTGTASGKTLAFHVAAIQRLLADDSSTIIAIYPLKALGTQQCQRWNSVLASFGLPKAEIIDGDVPVADRIALLRRSRVLVMTPDVIHAWLLSTLSDPVVRGFLAKLSLVVVDEV